MTIAIIIIIILVLAAFLLFRIIKVRRQEELLLLLHQQKYDAFDQLVNDKFTRSIFPRFNLEYLKLNSLIIQSKEKEIDKSFKTIFELKMTAAQKQDIYMKAFNYYVGMENPTKSKEMLDVINSFENEEMQREANTIYDIFILKRSNHLEQMLEDIKNQDDSVKGITEYLISVQYENLGDKKQATKYLELSKKHLNPNQDK